MTTLTSNAEGATGDNLAGLRCLLFIVQFRVTIIEEVSAICVCT